MSTPFSTAQFASIHKAQIDGLLTLANTAFAGVERLATLNLNTTRSLLEDSAGSTRALLGAKDFQEFVAIQSALTQPALDRAAAWSRDACEIGSTTQEALQKTIEVQFAEARQALDASLDALVKNAPAGTDTAVNASVDAFKSAISLATGTYETLKQAGTPAKAKPAAKSRKA